MKSQEIISKLEEYAKQYSLQETEEGRKEVDRVVRQDFLPENSHSLVRQAHYSYFCRQCEIIRQGIIKGLRGDRG